MADVASQLSLAWKTRAGGGGKTERRYLDFVVDGRPLSELLPAGDFITGLGWLPPQETQDYVDALLLKKSSTLRTGRVSLYVCPECADIGCGAITVQVEKTSTHLVWCAFGYQNDYDTDTPELNDFTHVGPFHFHKTEYWQVLVEGLSRGGLL